MSGDGKPGGLRGLATLGLHLQGSPDAVSGAVVPSLPGRVSEFQTFREIDLVSLFDVVSLCVEVEDGTHMETIAEARRQLAALGLVEGLPLEEALSRFGQALRIGDVGHRFTAFYAADMFAQDACIDWGHNALYQLLQSRFGLDRRRIAEMVRVGTRLRDLPLIDQAFREDYLDWSEILLLVRVASPEHEEAWLKVAQERSLPELQNEVKMAVPGGPPRKPGQRRGIREIHKRHTYTVGKVDDETIATAKRKLSAELARDVGEAEFVATLADLFLRLEEDGTVEGRTRVDSSLYRIVLRPEHVHEEDCSCGEHHDVPPLTVDCDLGRVPVLDEVLEACMHCDAETHKFDADGNPLLDPKTDKTLRTTVLIRDGYRCQCCGSPYRLQVHHIQYRSKHGKTKAFNLTVMCLDCHSLVHAGFLFLDGDNASDIVFVDRKGRPLHQRGERVDPAILLELSAPIRAKDKAGGSDGGVNPFVPPVTLESMPSVVDGAWWRRHAPLIHGSRGQGLRFFPGHPLPEEEEEENPEGRVAEGTVTESTAIEGSAIEGSATEDRAIEGNATEEGSATEGQVTESDVTKARADEEKAKAGAFDGLVGQQALLHRLLVAVDAARSQGRALPHTLFVGPPGTGKTTLARGVATALGAHLIPTTGPLLQNGHDLLVLLAEQL